MPIDTWAGDRPMSIWPALHHVGVGAAVDQRQHALAAEALGQQGGHDVVFVVVGQREKHVGFVDVFLRQQVFVGGLAVQHQGIGQPGGDDFGALPVAFDRA